MTFFVDANAIVYASVPSPAGDACVEILDAVARGEADGRTSTAVLDEVWHLELSGRAGEIAGTANDAYELFTPLLPVTDRTFRGALSLETEAIGANDRIHAATCLENGIEVIVSADSGFDQVAGIRRLDPLDAAARGELLGAG